MFWSLQIYGGRMLADSESLFLYMQTTFAFLFSNICFNKIVILFIWTNVWILFGNLKPYRIKTDLI